MEALKADRHVEVDPIATTTDARMAKVAEIVGYARDALRSCAQGALTTDSNVHCSFVVGFAAATDSHVHATIKESSLENPIQAAV